MGFEIGFMEQQCVLLDAVRRLVPEVNYLSASLQIKVLGKLREMFASMKEHAKLIRAAYAFQVLLVQLEKRKTYLLADSKWIYYFTLTFTFSQIYLILTRARYSLFLWIFFFSTVLFSYKFAWDHITWYFLLPLYHILALNIIISLSKSFSCKNML